MVAPGKIYAGRNKKSTPSHLSKGGVPILKIKLMAQTHFLPDRLGLVWTQISMNGSDWCARTCRCVFVFAFTHAYECVGVCFEYV